MSYFDDQWEQEQRRIQTKITKNINKARSSKLMLEDKLAILFGVDSLRNDLSNHRKTRFEQERRFNDELALINVGE